PAPAIGGNYQGGVFGVFDHLTVTQRADRHLHFGQLKIGITLQIAEGILARGGDDLGLGSLWELRIFLALTGEANSRKICPPICICGPSAISQPLLKFGMTPNGLDVLEFHWKELV